MTDKIKKQPTLEPVELAEMRSMLGITQTDDTERDAIILSRISSARKLCEINTRERFITQTWIKYVDCFYNRIRLLRPLQSITSVKYIDTDGIQQTLDPSNYKVNIVDGYLELGYGKSWPSARIESNAIEIEYICGYGNAADVPAPIKDAIKFWAAQWENYQGGIEGSVVVKTMPYAVKEILLDFKDFREHF